MASVFGDLVYEENLRLPDELVHNKRDDFEETGLLYLLQKTVAKLKSLPPSCQGVNNLEVCTHVLVSGDATRKPLHEDPYKVLEGGEHFSRLDVGSNPKGRKSERHVRFDFRRPSNHTTCFLVEIHWIQF